MTTINGTYTLFVDPYGTLRLQMLGAPRSVYVGGLVEVESSGTLLFVSNPTHRRDANNPPSEEDRSTREKKGNV